MLLMLLTSLPSLLFGCRRRDAAHGSPPPASRVLRYMWLSYYHLAAAAASAAAAYAATASAAAGTAG